MDSEEGELPDPDPLPAGAVGVRNSSAIWFANHLVRTKVCLCGALQAYHHFRNLSLHYLMTMQWCLTTDTNIKRKGL